jgi:pimeloyl-ACP methyl ester carboxylesterase/DNA-binding CsgD family transcriptional regulator
VATTNPSIRFCISRDGTRIAYAVSGEGPPLVKAIHLASHLETEADHPVLGAMLATIAQGRKLVRYDPRGFGLSDREVSDFSLQRHLEDFAAVVDAAGVARFAIIGFAGGGAVAAHYAAQHTERVSHLVFYGAFLLGRTVRSVTPEEKAETEMLLHLVEVGWGKDDPAFRQLYTSQYVPDGSAEQFSAFNELLRRAASPANAARFMRELHASDLRAAAARLCCPTLVLHARGDRRVPFEQGRALAAAIAGSRFVSLDSRNHALLPGEPALAQFAAELDAFLVAPAACAVAAQPASFDELTRREREVLDQLARGLDNASIGEKVGMSEKTVRNNVSSILTKLDVHTRSAAIVKARDAGFGAAPAR